MTLRFKNRLKNLTPPVLRDPIIKSYFSFRALLFTGNDVTCPCCGKSFKKFFPQGTHGACPFCGAAARHRSVMLYLKNKTGFFKDKLKVLHFAPELCFNRIFKKLSNLEYISADINSARAKENIDMTAIPYSNNTFNAILSIHVLEHIDDDRKAMKELYRVMKPGGWAILQVPVDYSREVTYENPDIKTHKDREAVFGHFDHRRIYGKDYILRLKEAGFDVLTDTFVNDFSKDDIMRYGLKSDDIIYFCRKR